MAVLLRRLADAYFYAMENLTDPRTMDWPLVGSPVKILALLGLYLYFVFKIGPAFMKNRPAFNLDKIMIVYNFIQIIVCLYLVYQSFRLAFWDNYSLFCQPVDFSDDPVAVEIAFCVWVYFILKVVDLLDTVFFVLRKKQKQVTFLHVYHHTGMVIVGWGGITFLPGGHSVLVGTINSVVHVVMYLYYLLTAINPSYKKSIWWKKHITQLQMVQFLLLVAHFVALLIMPNCNYPKFTAAIFIPQNMFMFVLFADFYRKEYLKKKPKADE